MGQIGLNRDELCQTDIGAEALRYIELLEAVLDTHDEEMERLRAENLQLSRQPTEDYLL